MKQHTLSDGIHIAWRGENAQDNWDIIDNAKKANNGKQYIWFHLKDHSSTHIILLLENDEIYTSNQRQIKNLIIECALLCVEHSKNKSRTVIYTEIKNVKKLPPDTGSVETTKKPFTITV